MGGDCHSCRLDLLVACRTTVIALARPIVLPCHAVFATLVIIAIVFDRSVAHVLLLCNFQSVLTVMRVQSPGHSFSVPSKASACLASTRKLLTASARSPFPQRSTTSLAASIRLRSSSDNTCMDGSGFERASLTA